MLKALKVLLIPVIGSLVVAAPQSSSYSAGSVPDLLKDASTGNEVESPKHIIFLIRDDREGPINGEYKFEFETSDGLVRTEEGRPTGPDGAVVQSGGWSFVYPDGTPAEFKFIADENGFQVESDLLPTPHPLPPHALEQIEKAERERAAGIIHDGQYREEDHGSPLPPPSGTGTATGSRKSGGGLSRGRETSSLAGDLGLQVSLDSIEGDSREITVGLQGTGLPSPPRSSVQGTGPSLPFRSAVQATGPSLPFRSAVQGTSPSLPSRSAAQGTGSSLPSKSAVQRTSPSLPSRSAVQGTSPSLPSRSAAQGTGSSLPSRSAVQGTSPSLPSRSAAQGTSSSLPSRSAVQGTSPSLPSRSAVQGTVPSLPSRSAVQGTGIPLPSRSSVGSQQSSNGFTGPQRGAAGSPLTGLRVTFDDSREINTISQVRTAGPTSTGARGVSSPFRGTTSSQGVNRGRSGGPSLQSGGLTSRAGSISSQGRSSSAGATSGTAGVVGDSGFRVRFDDSSELNIVLPNDVIGGALNGASGVAPASGSQRGRINPVSSGLGTQGVPLPGSNGGLSSQSGGSGFSAFVNSNVASVKSIGGPQGNGINAPFAGLRVSFGDSQETVFGDSRESLFGDNLRSSITVNGFRASLEDDSREIAFRDKTLSNTGFKVSLGDSRESPFGDSREISFGDRKV